MKTTPSLFLFLLPALLIPLGNQAFSQTQSPLFIPGGAGYLPLVFEATNASALVDVDGDGDLDIVQGGGEFSSHSPGNPVHLYLNDGQGRFGDATATHMPGNLAIIYSLDVGDVDRDGDPDIVVGAYKTPFSKGQSLLYLNDGKGFFHDATSTNFPVFKDRVVGTVLADVDGDKDLDLVLGVDGNPSRLFLNDGRGKFSFAPSGMMPILGSSAKTIAMGDLDGDGRPDLVIGNWWEKGKVLFNDGLGTFHSLPGRFPGHRDPTVSVVLRDVDRDGDLDILFGNWGTPCRLFLNNGKGWFKDVTTAQMPSNPYKTSAMTAGDIDGDGDVDIVLAADFKDSTYFYTRSKGIFYLNDGKGSFSEAKGNGKPCSWEKVTAFLLGDIDKDGDSDLIAWGKLVEDRLLLNDGKGNFLDLSEGLLGSRYRMTRGGCFADFDGDGDPDLFTANHQDPPILFFNDSYGAFKEAPPSHVRGIQWATAALPGDLDGDGDIDIVAGRFGSPFLLLNDGKGRFKDVSASNLPSLKRFGSTYTTLGDVDGDGDLDLLAWSYYYGVYLKLLLNDGKAKFTDGTASHLPGTYFKGFPRLFDADGDGDLDLFLLYSRQPRLLLNDGKGKFTDMTYPFMPSRKTNASSFACRDVDGDGDIDIVLVEYPVPALYLNDGKGRFTRAQPARFPSFNGYPLSAIMDDMDGDGDPDLAIGVSVKNEPSGSILFVNDGKGFFSLAKGAMPDLLENAVFLACADIDRDGDRDLFVNSLGGSNPGRNRIFLNLTRQAKLARLLRISFSMEVDFFSRPQTGGKRLMVLPLLAAARGKLSMPALGFFGLDPFTLVGFPVLYTDPATSSAPLVLAVPKDPVLAGAPIYFQGLVEGRQGGRRTFRFTNVAGGPILNF